MKLIKSLSRAADLLLGAGTAVLAVILLIYSAYMLFDSVYAAQNAFSSRELQIYKPDADSDPKLTFEMIREVNPDTTAWITIYDTNIDYPVLQGKDDLEYAIKDLYGNQSLTGAIYLSSDNERDYSDPYNVIFGHHVVNGAMFGDIDKYSDRDFFEGHREGILLTPYGNFDLNIFAFLRTDAYDNMVYYLNGNRDYVIPTVIDYVSKHAENYVETDADDVQKIIALSTCADYTTNGRAVVFATATPRYIPIENIEENDVNPLIIEHLVEGHEQLMDHWAVLNLVCVIMTLLTLLPLLYIGKKYRQFPFARKKAEELEDEAQRMEEMQLSEENPKVIIFPEDEAEEPKDSESTPEDKREIAKDLRRFRKKMIVGLTLEIIAVIAAVIAFILTENNFSAIIIHDEWTWLMVLIYALALLIDFICFRYRGERPPEGFEGDNEETDKQAET